MTDDIFLTNKYKYKGQIVNPEKYKLPNCEFFHSFLEFVFGLTKKNKKNWFEWKTFSIKSQEILNML